ncbi:tRNA(m5U54)methyltransferase [Pseudocyphellaria aurata]|nr:tRNA(m5U54)methyltransferase [Pseudocyphellaria aurata]
MARRKSNKQHPGKRQKTSKASKDGGTSEGVLLEDIRRLITAHNASELSAQNVIGEDVPNPQASTYKPPERFTEIEVKISQLSAAGDGLGISSTADHVYVVPFTLPGDIVRAKVVNYFAQDQYTLADFVKVVAPAPRRDDSLIRCPYFSRCSGCQFQMLNYEDQLIHKRTVIERAYRSFSTLTPDVVPPVGETIGSPLQYGYRTKLTPHFDGPPGSLNRKAGLNGAKREQFDQVPPIGFNLKGTRKIVDIEDCPLGTEAVRSGLTRERNRVTEEMATFRKGATLLLRESTSRRPDRRTLQTSVEKSSEKIGNINGNEGGSIYREDLPTNAKSESRSLYMEEKTCITDANAISTEFIDDFEFANPAGAFFQNNNSILPKFTAYIRNHILPSGPEASTISIKHLIDAYCGSGLFTVTLSSLFSSSLGIDIAGGSIASAKKNAVRNKVSNASFMTADASALFKEVDFSPEETIVIIDPPRKGCDSAFLHQLLHFGPQRVVYVSCNVHTQARDVGVLVEGLGKWMYEIESLRGFDFFPQTGHVEGVAILKRSCRTSSRP